jgi:hypothetical protein
VLLTTTATFEPLLLLFATFCPISNTSFTFALIFAKVPLLILTQNFSFVHLPYKVMWLWHLFYAFVFCPLLLPRQFDTLLQVFANIACIVLYCYHANLTPFCASQPILLAVSSCALLISGVTDTLLRMFFPVLIQLIYFNE